MASTPYAWRVTVMSSVVIGQPEVVASCASSALKERRSNLVPVAARVTFQVTMGRMYEPGREGDGEIGGSGGASGSGGEKGGTDGLGGGEGGERSKLCAVMAGRAVISAGGSPRDSASCVAERSERASIICEHAASAAW